MLDLPPLSLAQWIAFAAFLGAWVGSFLNVVAHRLPRMMEIEEQSQVDPASAPQTPYNLAWPPSHCPNCQARVRWYHNIPIISWLWLRGTCPDCDSAIPVRYLLLEIAGAIVCGAAVARFGPTLEAVAAATLLCSLLVLAFIDLEHWLLPDAIVLPLIWLGLLANSFTLFTDLESAVWGAAAGYLALRLLGAVWSRLRGVEALGRGDCKLAAALGAWMGWPGLAVALFLASLGTVLVGLVTRRRMTDPLPFGPGLAVAGTLVLLIRSENFLLGRAAL